QAYLKEADNSPPIMSAAPTDAGATTNPGPIVFRWLPAQEFDTDIVDYQLQVRAEPGGTIIYNAWVGKVLSHTITYSVGKTLYARVQAKNGAELISEWSPWSDGILIKSNDSPDTLVANLDDTQNISPPDTLVKVLSTPEKRDTLLTRAAADPSNSMILANEIPHAFHLEPNYPNPFNSATTIRYQLPTPVPVRITIYNAQGQTIAALVDEFQPAGSYAIIWDGSNADKISVPSGIYLCRLQAGRFHAIQKMILVR
ncbi:MAG: T9SS type A sorting domain-containing protein, partial [candidate division KSB1 bacterium]|nr:T9SS type A sorting domain-containing protein [candidate division KSB1 bacterium]